MSSLLRVVFDTDTTPPGTPSIISVTPVGQGRLDITWTSVTDTGGSGLAGYNLQIDGSTLITLGVQTSYSHTGLTPSSAHTYKVQSRDANGNTSPLSTQASGNAAAPPAVYNPTYPRLGTYALGGTQIPSAAELARRHVNIVNHYPGWQQSKGTTLSALITSAKAASTIGTKIFAYTIYPEIPNQNANVGEANWEVWQYALANNLWAYTNGVAETGQVPSYDAGWSKCNYTINGKLVAGKNWVQWKIDWDTRLNKTGGTFSNGSASLPVTSISNLDGLYFDNVFYGERSPAADYDRNGTVDTITSAASKTYIQSSHAAAISYYRTLWPGSPAMVNSADWTGFGPTMAGTPLDQAAEGGVIEHAQNFESNFSTCINNIKVQMDAYAAPKLGVLEVDIVSLTNYQEMRYWLGISLLTDTYYYPHAGSGLLTQDLPSTWYDEFAFNLGASSEAVQTAARYQAGASGEGIWRRDFANGIVLVGAKRASGASTAYAAQALGGTFYRLSGTQAPTVNNGAAVTSVTLSPRDAVILSRTPTVSSTGFTPQAGFTVQALDGNFNHGSRLQITRASGSWAARTYGQNSWLFDTFATSYQNGVAVNALAAYADGATLPEDVSGGPWLKYGQVAHPIKVARSTGSRTPPNSRTAAWLYSTTGVTEMKCEVMEPRWPAAWGGSSPVNQSIYVSYYIRFKTISRIWNNGKFGRFNSGGSNYFYPGGSNTSLGNIESTGPLPSESTWYRIEYYLDYDLNVLDVYGGYRYERQVESFGTTPGPREWRNTTPYNAVSNRGGYLYTSSANNTPLTIGPFPQALAATLGFDGQSNGPFTDCEIDIANFYVDPHWERFEISDSSTWSLAPNNFGSTALGIPREVQGRWSRDSAGVATLYLNIGQFPSLSGKYLWYVDDFKTATLIGQFQ